MSAKTYLSNQIRLMTLNAYDLFTQQEYEIYTQIISIVNEIKKLNNPEAEEKPAGLKVLTAELTGKKKELQHQLEELIKTHKGIPRKVRLESVLDLQRFTDENGQITLPQGISWNDLKLSRRIAEFASEESRAMGLKHWDVTFDKVILKWKSFDVLEQIVLDGFTMPILNKDGSVTEKHYDFITASAGQLRRDKIQAISTEMWERIHDQLECGLDWEKINEKNGVNCNKYMAYRALPSSATDQWDFDIDRCIVIKDFEAPVIGRMKYIKPDYSYEIAEKTVSINHSDGIGMMLPSVSEYNFMVRAPWIKGLLASFDFIHFCEVNGVPPVIEDYYGKVHNLVEENIQVIFTESQFKMAKYYNSWDEYKAYFKKCNCHLCKTNYEEPWIKDSYLNYQMLQTLTDFTEEDIQKLTQKEHQRIESIATDKNAMLRTLGADEKAITPYRAALAVYPELLREAYTRESLKSIKKRWIQDAKSGKIKYQNKRLFAIPDLYAACQYWFMGIKEPEGLLKDGEVACKIYKKFDEADVLRSPHLYMEHAVRNIVHNDEIYKWFYTNGIYTSCHDLISRILQFDVDGDQLNVVIEPCIIDLAKRNIEKYDVVPLFYDGNKAKPDILSKETMYMGLRRAHDYSGIGQISNALTKLWNRPNPNRDAAAWLCYYNNLVIDGAKTGYVNSYENYPEINSQINAATGGKRGRMPFFFQFSKNGRKNTKLATNKRKKYAKQNRSIMNVICSVFDDIGNINMNFAGIDPFNWQMLMPGPCNETNNRAVSLFCELDNMNMSNVIEAVSHIVDTDDVCETLGYDVLKDYITSELTALCGSLRAAYPFITKYLFTGENFNKPSHKQMYWRVFGDIALEILCNNIRNCSICPVCKMLVPSWASQHTCQGKTKGYYECVDCGKLCERKNSRQYRCETCQEAHRKIDKRMERARNYRRKQVS